MLKILTVFGLVFVASTAQPAAAQAWFTIPCADSAIRYSPEVRCVSLHASRSAGSGIQAVGGYYGTAGYAAGSYISFLLIWPVGETYITAYTNADAMAAIKGQDPQTRDRASNWGDLRHIGGDISYVTFASDKQQCVGIDRAGPVKTYGYAWQIVGFACRPEIPGAPEAFVKSILANLRIGK